MTFLTTKNKIASILEEDTSLAKVYAYPEQDPQEFPCATIDVVDASSEERFDSNKNFLTMNFTARIFIIDENTENNCNKRLELMESVSAKLREYADTLDNTVQKLDINGYSPLYTDTNMKYCYFEINILASILKTI